MNRHEIRIVTKIIKELSLFFMFHGHYDFSMETQYHPDKMFFILKVRSLKPTLIDTIKTKLNRERELEVETYGWELVGELDIKTELEVVGLLIDSVTVEISGDLTTLTLLRENRYQK